MQYVCVRVCVRARILPQHISICICVCACVRTCVCVCVCTRARTMFFRGKTVARSPPPPFLKLNNDWQVLLNSTQASLPHKFGKLAEGQVDERGRAREREKEKYGEEEMSGGAV